MPTKQLITHVLADNISEHYLEAIPAIRDSMIKLLQQSAALAAFKGIEYEDRSGNSRRLNNRAERAEINGERKTQKQFPINFLERRKGNRRRDPIMNPRRGEFPFQNDFHNHFKRIREGGGEITPQLLRLNQVLEEHFKNITGRAPLSAQRPSIFRPKKRDI